LPHVIGNRLFEICLCGVLVICAIGKDGVPGRPLFWYGGRDFFLKTCVPWAFSVIFKTGLLKWPRKGETDSPSSRKSDGFFPLILEIFKSPCIKANTLLLVFG
jgi:hypothetical protein